MKYTILLLEDDLQLSDTIKQFLQMKGYEVYVAYDGFSAWDLVYEKHIDLILLDVKVPNMSGFEVLKNIRSKKIDTPVIFITSLSSADDVERGFELGCDDFIRIPFALKELLVRVESLLKRSYNTHDKKIKIDDGLIFDIKEMVLSKDGKKMALKTKELKLLAFFLHYPNELLDYEKINQALWEYDEEPNNASLRTYIKTIRSIIGKDKIETVKNIGYRYVKQ
jgi:DNA-binding response OmpR family regulator